MEKKCKTLLSFLGGLPPDWENTARAATTGLGSIGLNISA